MRPCPLYHNELDLRYTVTHEGMVMTRMIFYKRKTLDDFRAVYADADPDEGLRVLDLENSENAREFVGHSDFRVSLTLSPEAKDQLLLALMGKAFGSDVLVLPRVRRFLQEQAIPFCEECG